MQWFTILGVKQLNLKDKQGNEKKNSDANKISRKTKTRRHIKTAACSDMPLENAAWWLK